MQTHGRAGARPRYIGALPLIRFSQWCLLPGKPLSPIKGRSLQVSNLDKILYPAAGFTKGQLIDYYVSVSPVLLPHLKNRPITLKRYPEGVDGFFFYEKQCPTHRPAWVKTTPVSGAHRQIDYCVINDLPSLVWAANLADIELHTFLHRAPAIARPNYLAFDLDPGPPADIRLCCKVALWLRELLHPLHAFPKTSGSKGLQLFVPLNTPVTYAKTKPFALALAERLEHEHPEAVVSKMQKSLRANKILIDWSQNDAHKTTVSVYSLRARQTPTVSTPLTWEEVEQAVTMRKSQTILQFSPASVLARIQTHGDLFQPLLTLKQRLPASA